MIGIRHAAAAAGPRVAVRSAADADVGQAQRRRRSRPGDLERLRRRRRCRPAAAGKRHFASISCGFQHGPDEQPVEGDEEDERQKCKQRLIDVRVTESIIQRLAECVVADNPLVTCDVRRRVAVAQLSTVKKTAFRFHSSVSATKEP